MDSLLNNENIVVYGGLYWNRLTEQRLSDERSLERYGYKVYSQNDEDGIIQEIFRRIDTTNKTFVEFGVQDGLESNGHYLLLQGWNGGWIEGDPNYVKTIQERFRPVISNHRLSVKNAFITKDNINELILDLHISGEIDLLSIDIDGNDYYVWKAINVVNPRVVVIEYNGKMPPDLDWKMAYNETHIWEGSDWHGASLKALELLGGKLGYQLVGTNLNGANAFFVRKDLAKGFLEPATAENLYNPLRLNIVHKNGHSARYCLACQKENMGIFNYKKYDDFIGWHDEELDEKQNVYRWMAGKESSFRFYNEYCDNLCLKYYIPETVFHSNCSPIIQILLNENHVKTINIDKNQDEIIVNLGAYKEQLVLITIISNILWSPAKDMQSGDERELGFAFYF